MLWSMIAYSFYRLLWFFAAFVRHLTQSKRQIGSFKIFCRRKLILANLASPFDFIYLFPTSISTEELLQSPNWALYTLDENFAYFVRLPKPMDQYNAEASSFMYVDLFRDAEELARIRIQHLQTIAQQVKYPSGSKVVLLTNTPRCGSTLLARMLQVGPVVVFPEHDALTLLSCFLNEGLWPQRQFQAVLQAVFKLLCKNLEQGQVYIFKTRSTGVHLVRFLSSEQFVPAEFINIFMCRRDLTAQLVSNEKMCRVLCRYDCMARGHHFCPLLVHFFLSFFRLEPKALKLCALKDLKGFAFCLLAAPLAQFHCLTDRFASVVVYENLLTNPETEMRGLLELLSLPPGCLQESLERMKTDSQENTELSRSIFRRTSVADLGQEQKRRLGRMALLLGLDEKYLPFGV